MPPRESRPCALGLHAAAVRAHRSRGGSGELDAETPKKERCPSYSAATAHAVRAGGEVILEPGGVAGGEHLVQARGGQLAGAVVVRGGAAEERAHARAPGELVGGGFPVRDGLPLDGEGLAQALPGPGQQRAGRDVAHAQGGGELETGEVVQLGEEERRTLPLRDPLQRPLELAREVRLHHEVLRRRGRVARLADEGDEADDPVASEVVQRDAVGDLVEPCPRVLGLLQRVVGTVGLDERVLREVRGQLRVPEHAQQVRVDLALVLREQVLDEAERLVAIPPGAHG